MNDAMFTVTMGALVHDIGKVLYRSGRDGRSHSISGAEYWKRFCEDRQILNCIRYHHKKDLVSANLEKDDPAFIVYLADNLAAGSDRRPVEGEGAYGFDKEVPLSSIFNLLSGNDGHLVHSPNHITPRFAAPQEKALASTESYSRILSGFEAGMSGIVFSPEYVNSFQELIESYFSYIPSSTQTNEVTDISLYDHVKITAAYATCILEWLQAEQFTDFKELLLDGEKDFCKREAFLLFSMDMSGIQSFIYRVAHKGALKALRARSFYLEVLLENAADEILDACGLPRANLLYTGGGHAYMLLANTEKTRHSIVSALESFNRQLREEFGTELFIAYGFSPCSANTLMSKAQDPLAYTQLFQSVSSQTSAMKLHRYNASELRTLNRIGSDSEGRECTICGSASVFEATGEENECYNCASFSRISSALLQVDGIFMVTRERQSRFDPFVVSAEGRGHGLQVTDINQARKRLAEDSSALIRLYSKNAFRTGLHLST